MKVKELIEYLETVDKDADVVVYYGDSYCCKESELFADMIGLNEYNQVAIDATYPQNKSDD